LAGFSGLGRIWWNMADCHRERQIAVRLPSRGRSLVVKSVETGGRVKVLRGCPVTLFFIINNTSLFKLLLYHFLIFNFYIFIYSFITTLLFFYNIFINKGFMKSAFISPRSGAQKLSSYYWCSI